MRFACHGECPKNRFISTPDGEPGLNYLCAGYKAFFTHIDRPMRLMADLLRQGRYADEAMAMLAEGAGDKPHGKSCQPSVSRSYSASALMSVRMAATSRSVAGSIRTSGGRLT